MQKRKSECLESQVIKLYTSKSNNYTKSVEETRLKLENVQIRWKNWRANFAKAHSSFYSLPLFNSLMEQINTFSFKKRVILRRGKGLKEKKQRLENLLNVLESLDKTRDLLSNLGKLSENFELRSPLRIQIQIADSRLQSFKVGWAPDIPYKCFKNTESRNISDAQNILKYKKLSENGNALTPVYIIFDQHYIIIIIVSYWFSIFRKHTFSISYFKGLECSQIVHRPNVWNEAGRRPTELSKTSFQ